MNREKVAKRFNYLSLFMLLVGIGLTLASWYWDQYVTETRIAGLIAILLGFGFLYAGQSFFCAYRSQYLSEEGALQEVS